MVLFSCDKETQEQILEYDGVPVTKIISVTVNYMGGIRTTKTLDFVNNKITYLRTIGSPKDTDDSKIEEKASFLEEDEKYMIDRFYTYGLFDLEERYLSDKNIMDGGGWGVSIYFEDGSVRTSSGSNAGPKGVFPKCAIAIYDITHYEFWTVPPGYIAPPKIGISQGCRVGNSGTDGGVGWMYKYKWHTTTVDNGDLYQFASTLPKSSHGFGFEGDDVENYLRINTDTESDYFFNPNEYTEKYKQCVVKEYDNVPELTNERVLLKTKWLKEGKYKRVNIKEHKIYTIELTFSHDWYSIVVVPT